MVHVSRTGIPLHHRPRSRDRDRDLSPDFIVAMTAFVTDGDYTIGERSDGVPILYRFAKPQNPDFPCQTGIL